MLAILRLSQSYKLLIERSLPETVDWLATAGKMVWRKQIHFSIREFRNLVERFFNKIKQCRRVATATTSWRPTTLRSFNSRRSALRFPPKPRDCARAYSTGFIQVYNSRAREVLSLFAK